MSGDSGRPELDEAAAHEAKRVCREAVRQALGTVMAQRGCGANSAMLVLVGESVRRDVSIYDVAREILGGS